MDEYFWDSKIEFLKTTRERMWNDDYFAFLTERVWKLDKPKNVIDFGCGYGYLGLKLMPLLPEGSTYTGLDKGDKLLKEAHRIYKDAPFKTEFINTDLNEYKPQEKYDIAICQAVLRHIPNSEAILKKMVDSVVPSGMVICIEVNRKMEEAGLYIHGAKRDGSRDTALLQQWENELKNGGRDYMMGIKIPVYMEKLGLKNVGVRINDYVDFISPERDGEMYNERLGSFLDIINLYGLKLNEAEGVSVIQATSLIISYGTK